MIKYELEVHLLFTNSVSHIHKHQDFYHQKHIFGNNFSSDSLLVIYISTLLKCSSLGNI